MRILIRTSKWAIWARRCGSFAVPLTLLPVLLHREGLIGSLDFVAVETVALSFAVLGLLLGLGGFVRLWRTGDRGWGKASWGIVFSTLCLLPFGYFGYLALKNPVVTEISTDFRTPVPLSLLRPAQTPPALQAEIAAHFPNVRTRSYPIAAAQIFEILAQLVEEEGWDISISRNPDDTGGVGLLDGVALRLLGWRDEVAVRVLASDAGATIDMRSAPFFAFPDFGENGRRVEKLLLALDGKVTALLRTAAGTPATDPDADSGDAPPTVTGTEE